jgi:ATP-dependent DNA ligase
MTIAKRRWSGRMACRFDELRRRESARSAVLFAFDLIEHNGEDLRALPFLDRKAALAWLLHGSKAGKRHRRTGVNAASIRASTLQVRPLGHGPDSPAAVRARVGRL